MRGTLFDGPNMACSMGILVLGMVCASQAQQTAAPGGPPQSSSEQLETVTVTARKRSELLQDVPATITSFSGSALEAASVNDVKDFVALVPNVILQPSYRAGVVNLSSRGDSTPQQGDPPVAIVIDGVQASAQDFLNQQLFDIDRVEFLKGPQGALYGQGAIAGAINIVTKKPTDQFEGFASEELSRADSSGSADTRATAGISGPLIADHLFYRVAALYENRDGYIENTFLGRKADPLETGIVRASLLGQYDSLTFQLGAFYQRSKDGNAYYDVVNFPLNAAGNPDTTKHVDFNNISYTNNSNLPTSEDRELYSVSSKVDYKFPGLTLTSVTGFNTSLQSNFGDLDFGPTQSGTQNVDYNVRVANEEIRITSDAADRLRYVAGVFYQHREIYNLFTTPPYLGTGIPITLDRSQFDLSPAAQTYSSIDEIRSNSYGVFGDLDFDVTDRLTTTLALRYDTDHRTSQYLGTGAGESATVAASVPKNVAATFSQPQPKIDISYKFTPEIMVYADAAQGFRSGSVNPWLAAQNPGVSRILKKEVANSYEAGFKTQFFDHRAQANLSIFHVNYENWQYYFYAFGSQNMINIANAAADGLELDGALVVNSHLTLNGSAGYLHTRIDNFNGTNINRGNTLPDSPDSTINFSGVYKTPIAPGLDLFGRAAYRRDGRIYFDPADLNYDTPKNYVDLSLGIEKTNWTVQAFVRNLTDERTVTNFAQVFGQGGNLQAALLPNMPRVFGLSASTRF